MPDQIILADHAGVPLTHGKPKVNGVEIHYAIGGAGEPVFLLHGGQDDVVLAPCRAAAERRTTPSSRSTTEVPAAPSAP